MSKSKDKALALSNMILGSTMSFEDIMSAYFSNDGDTILKGVTMAAKDPEVMFHTLEQIDYEITNEDVLTQSSNFGDLQNKVVDQVISEDNISFLEANIINDGRIIGEENCPNITAARSKIEMFKEQTLSNEMTKAA